MTSAGVGTDGEGAGEQDAPVSEARVGVED